MASRRAQIRDAAVQAIAALTEAEPVMGSMVVAGKYVPILTLDALATQGFTATVWFGDEKRELYTRGTSRKDLDIHIGLEGKIQPTTAPDGTSGDPTAQKNYAELDTDSEIAEKVAAFFEPFQQSYPNQAIAQQLLKTVGAQWVKTTIKAPYSGEALRTERVFASGVIVTLCYL